MALSPPPDGSPRARFAKLLKQHMRAGTRASGKRGGPKWGYKKLAELLSLDERTLYNYTSGKNRPPCLPLVAAFFGDNTGHVEARDAFVAAFEEAWGIAPPPLPPPEFGREIVAKPIHPAIYTIGDLFTGREDFLLSLRASLLRRKNCISAICGLGGIGKTRTAIEYALRHQEDYTAILFANASDELTLTADLAALTGLLRLPEHAVQEMDIQVAAAIAWLMDHAGWLLILDNVDSPEALRAVMARARSLRNGQILLTSRLRGAFAQDIEVLDLGLLPPVDAAAYLLKATADGRRSEPDAEAGAMKLTVALDHLTLALVYAAGYIRERHLTFARYLQEWNANYQRVLDWAQRDVIGYPRPLMQTWITSTDQLTQPARALLERLSFFTNDLVPEFLLDVPFPGEEIADGLDALLNLERFSLITADAKADHFTIHKVLRDVTNRILATDPDAYKIRLTEALGWNAAAFHGSNPRDIKTWPRLELLAPHAEALVWAADKAGIGSPTSHLMGELEALFDAKAAYARAEPLARRALAIDEARLDPNDQLLATRLSNLAELLRATDRLKEAEPLYRRALKITEASPGENHHTAVIRLNNLATLLHTTNRLAEAERLYRRALDVAVAGLRSDDPLLATCLLNFAALLRATSRLSEAEDLYRQALAIEEANFGPDHPRVANQLNGLAGVLRATGRFQEAEIMIRRALAINEASHHSDHPDTAECLNSLGQLLQATGRLTEAEPLYRRAVGIIEASFGPAHSQMANHLNSLANLLHVMGDDKETEALYRQALAIDEACFGPDHPEVAKGLGSLGRFLRDTNRTAEAELLLLRAAAIFDQFEKTTGHTIS
jgi:tetratricopeptide (TPR) repeat protein